MVRIAATILCLLALVGAWAQPPAADPVTPATLNVRYSITPDTMRVVLDVPQDAVIVDKSTPMAAVVSVAAPLAQAIPVIPITDLVVNGIAVTPDEKGQALLTVAYSKPRKTKVFTLPAADGKPFRVVVDVLKRYHTEEKKTVSPAISYTRIEDQTDDRFLAQYILDIDARDPHVRMGVAAATGERERVSSMIVRLGAVAGVNGGYFLDGTRPVGLLKMDGLVYSLPLWGRTAAAFPKAGPPIFGTPQGRWRVTLPDGTTREYPDHLDASVAPPPPSDVVIAGMNFDGTPTNTDGLTVVIHQGKVSARGTAWMPLERGDYALVLRGQSAKDLDAQLALGAPMTVTPVLPAPWDAFPCAVGAGPRLLANGEAVNTAVAERFKADIANGKPTRTGLGVTPTGHVILLSVGGGATLDELAGLLKARGAVDAMNLDGGGSTCMVVGAETVTNPAGWVRPVASGVLVFDDRVPPLPMPAPTPSAAPAPPVVGQAGVGK